MFIRITIITLFAAWVSGCYLSHEREENPVPLPVSACTREYSPASCGPHPDGPANYFHYWHEPADELPPGSVVYKVRITSAVDGTVAYGSRIRSYFGTGDNIRVVDAAVSDVLEHECVLDWLECRRSAEWDEGIPEQELPILFAFRVRTEESFGFIIEGDFAERFGDGFVGHTAGIGSDSTDSCPDDALAHLTVQRCDPVARCLPVETELVSTTLRIDGVTRDVCFVHVATTPSF
jgi:hypothetical protein